jgi:hypothetical protein
MGYAILQVCINSYGLILWRLGMIEIKDFHQYFVGVIDPNGRFIGLVKSSESLKGIK